MSPNVNRLALAMVWLVITSAAAFVGSAAAVLACSKSADRCIQCTDNLWLAEFAAVALVPSIILYFLLDCWRPDSRARFYGFAAPLVLAAGFLALMLDVLPRTLDCRAIWQYAVAFAGAFGGVWLAVRSKPRAATLGRPRLQFGLASLFVLTTIGAILCAALKTLGAELGLSVCGWSVAAVVVAVAVQGTGETPRGGRLSACLLALAIVYAPFVAMFVNTLLFNHCESCQRTWLYLLWVAPGGMIEMLATLFTVRHGVNLPPVLAFVIAALLSAVVVGVTAWLARRVPLVRWPSLAIVAILAAFGALAADALLRA
jgi:hypothetical protein